MQPERDDDKSLETDIAALSETALNHYRQGEWQQARELCHRILRKQQRPAAILILAKIAHKQGEFPEAIECYEQFLRTVPEHGISHFDFGTVLEECGHTERAIEHYEKSISLDAGNERAHRQLGVALRQFGRIHDAIECFERALRLRPDYVAAHIDFARTLLQLGRAGDAIVPLKHAIKLEPDNSEAHIALAMTLKQLGRTDDSAQQLEKLLAFRPACGEAHYHVSMIKPEPRQIAVVEDVLRDPGLSKRDAVYCHFALGNLHQSGESFDRAFDHFRTANSLQRETFEYDADQFSQTVDRLIAVYSKGYFERNRNFGSVSQLPVFIVGMPRSGTTLVEQILCSHRLVHGAGELEAIRGTNHAIARQLGADQPYPECMSSIDSGIAEEHAAKYLRELARHCPSATRITDKFPGNFVAIGLIKTLLPEARIVHCMRDALDNCVSLYSHCFMPMSCSFELTELGQYYLDYQRLMSHWQSLFRDEIFTVRYEDLVMDQEKVSRQLVDYVGLDWDENCLEFQNNERNVSSPSNMQIRQPIYKSSIGRWKRYDRHLQPLINTLEESEHSPGHQT